MRFCGHLKRLVSLHFPVISIGAWSTWTGAVKSWNTGDYRWAGGVKSIESEMWAGIQPDGSGNCIALWKLKDSHLDDISCKSKKNVLCEILR